MFLSAAQDPFGARRSGRNETAPKTPGAPDPSYYRLWGLQPLQSQFLRAGEVVMEVWARPEGGSRQALVRVTLRSDRRAFVQARAGVPCCTPAILRRIEIDAELPVGSGEALNRIADDPFWSTLPDAVIEDGQGAVEMLCVGGVSYEFYLLQRDRYAHLRRDCGGAETGSAAEVLAGLIAPALGRDPRFDYLFPRGADFSREKQQHASMLAAGGRLVGPRPRS